MSADELDVDAELLAMAGDDSSDNEDAVSSAGELNDSDANYASTTQKAKIRTPSEEAKPSTEKVLAEEPASARRGVAQKVRKNRRKRDREARRREIEDELGNLGDGSPSPEPSIASAMSETSADAPASPDNEPEAPLYPLEGKYLSQTDRETILGLPEIERETILADRAQQILRREQDIQLQRQIAASEAAASKRKRKAGAADLEESARKTSRPKVGKVGRSALDDYKKAREAKGAERTRFDSGKDTRRERSRSGSDDGYGDRDRDRDRYTRDDSEVEWADSYSRRERDEAPAELKDFDRCRIGRTAFAKVCFYPNFEQTMKGCFARVSIGLNRETGENMYRMAQIKGFTQGKPYTMEPPSSTSKPLTTDVYALVSHGSAEKPWPFSACSDSPLTSQELSRYASTLEKERIRLPRKPWLLQKLSDIHAFLDPQWDEANLAFKFRKQREVETRVKAIKEAREARISGAGEATEPAHLERDLSNSSFNGTNGSPAKPKPTPTIITSTKPAPNAAAAPASSAQERLAALNAKNRGKNADDVRRALLEERRKLQREREKALAERKARLELEEAERKRRKEAEGLLGAELFGDSDFSRAGTPGLGGNGSGVSTPRFRRSRAGTPVDGSAGGAGGVKKEKGLGALVAEKMARRKGLAGGGEGEDELGGLDLGIDVEI